MTAKKAPAQARSDVQSKVVEWLMDVSPNFPFTLHTIAEDIQRDPSSISNVLRSIHAVNPRWLRKVKRGLYYIAPDVNAPEIEFNVRFTVDLPQSVIDYLGKQAELSRNGATAQTVASAILRNAADAQS